jgi:hypothetical protein
VLTFFGSSDALNEVTTFGVSLLMLGLICSPALTATDARRDCCWAGLTAAQARPVSRAEAIL